MIYKMFHPPPVTTLQCSVRRVMGLGSSVILENRDSLNGANTNGVKGRKPTPAGLFLLTPDVRDTLQSLFFIHFFLVEEVKHSELNLSLFTTTVKYIIEFHIFISVKEKYLKDFILWRQGKKKRIN